MNFDFEKFTNEIHLKYSKDLSLEKVKDLLNVDEPYDLDTQKSKVKRLALKLVHFRGMKSEGDIINFSSSMVSGINIWIADNLKGKSSLFKIIQFALTGNNNIKKDIKKWLKEILLVFEIDDKNYTAYLNLEKYSLSAKFYKQNFNSLDDFKDQTPSPIFESKSADDYQKQIQQFFFSQFSYYSMKWTQKDSRKESTELRESNASWSTYFKSIYLESKDTDKLMYGDQDKKVFQMLLGLGLTYPINRLTVKKEMLQNQKARKESPLEAQEKNGNGEKELLELELKEITAKLENDVAQPSLPLNLSNLYEDRRRLAQTLDTEITRAVNFGREIQENKSIATNLKSRKETTQNELSKISREINSIERRIVDYQQYLEIGSFFSNLDIKHCPSCNHTVSQKVALTESQDKQCYVCHEPVIAGETQINREAYLAKTENLKTNSQKLVGEKLELEKNLATIQKEYDQAIINIERLEKDLLTVGDTALLNQQLREMEDQINRTRESEKTLVADQTRIELISQKAVLDYRLKQLGGSSTTPTNDLLKTEIALLKDAINQLSEERYRMGRKILKRLSDLMLAEIHEFGLNSITDIHITDNFDILYKQDGDDISFGEIAEGEQLRAKLAFYLSLIQLEIEQNVGRHTRLLMIDSPAKEEGDSAYLEGLSDVLRNIETRLGNKLQILIGTAERGFTGVGSNEYIVPEGEFVF